jgi:hypothetical protein
MHLQTLAFLSLPLVALADFHMLGVQVTQVPPQGGQIFFTTGGQLIPSNKYNKDWLTSNGLAYSLDNTSAGHTKLKYCNYKTSSFSTSGICGGDRWQFDKTSSGFTVKENGQEIAKCYPNCQSKEAIRWSSGIITYDAYEDYVCYSYYCKE